MKHDKNLNELELWEKIIRFNVSDFDNGQTPTDTVYSDRLYQWDSDKHDKLCIKYFGNTWQYWGGRTVYDIELFLREYTGHKSLILCKVEELENQSNGYPYWRFDYKINQNK